MMQVYVRDSQAEANDLAAHLVVEAVRSGARVLGLATGQTMIGVYAALVAQVRADRIATERWTTFNLDEYVGIGPDHPGSFHHFMTTHLFRPLGLGPQQSHLLNGLAPDLEAECNRFERLVMASPPDVQILGIGQNGHIGFNEPGTPWDSGTHRVTLTAATIAQNAPDFPGSMPREALTMGIGTILMARAIIVVATGAAKAPAVYRAVREEPSLEVPASALRLHPDVRYVLDTAAAERLFSDPRWDRAASVVEID